MTSPDVSIVIAAYNAADTIQRAIRSAITQQGVTVEVIVAATAIATLARMGRSSSFTRERPARACSF